jgi:hypothetical protein
MSVATFPESCKTNSHSHPVDFQLPTQIASDLEQFARDAAKDGRTLDEFERHTFDHVLKIGKAAVDLFIQHQGNGDLGEAIETEDGSTLQRSQETQTRSLRTVFGRHEFQTYVYSTGGHQAIELRPLDARMALPASIDSYLFEEFSQFFCVEQAFGRSRQAIQMMLKQEVCEDQLQAINHRLGAQAEAFLDDLPIPPSEEEGEIMVLTADGKGVPLIREDAAKVPVTGEASKRPGNRRMATLAGVYTVDPFVRTAQDVLASLFRDEREPVKRPPSKFKDIVSRFARDYDNDDGTRTTVNGLQEAFDWAGQRISDRRREGQVVVRLLDGQESLRTTSDACLESFGESVDVDILDIIHVAGYVKLAAKAFHRHSEHREAFCRDQLLKILQGSARSVIHSLRIKASLHKLKGQKLKDVMKCCRYFENNLDRMQYDEYLSKGYPIATGVIEGACRHLVKDRMERTGMRWRLENAEAMLSVRGVYQSDHIETFHKSRMAAEQEIVHPHKSLIEGYKPLPV